MRMKYSFIVPIYNVENYLKKCIDSLLAQTYGSFEIILVDDGSTDSSGAIADEYAEKYSEIIQVIHQVNTGQGGARNTGITVASGDYLLMVDSDDYVSENMLEILDGYLEKYNCDILIFNYIEVKKSGEQQMQYLHEESPYTQITPGQFILELAAPWNKVFRASLFQESDIQFPNRIYYEDLATSPCLALHANQIGAIDTALYYYVQRESSTMHSRDTQRMTDVCKAMEIVLNYFKKCGRFEQYHQELEYLTVSHVLIATIQRMLQVRYEYEKIRTLERFVEKYFCNYIDNPYIQEIINKPEYRRVKRIVEKKHFELFIGYVLRKIKNCIIKS